MFTHLKIQTHAHHKCHMTKQRVLFCCMIKVNFNTNWTHCLIFMCNREIEKLKRFPSWSNPKLPLETSKQNINRKYVERRTNRQMLAK